MQSVCRPVTDTGKSCYPPWILLHLSGLSVSLTKKTAPVSTATHHSCAIGRIAKTSSQGNRNDGFEIEIPPPTQAARSRLYDSQEPCAHGQHAHRAGESPLTTYLSVFEFVYVHVSECVSVCMYIYIYIHVYMYTYMCVHIYMYIYISYSCV